MISSKAFCIWAAVIPAPLPCALSAFALASCCAACFDVPGTLFSTSGSILVLGDPGGSSPPSFFFSSSDFSILLPPESLPLPLGAPSYSASLSSLSDENSSLFSAESGVSVMVLSATGADEDGPSGARKNCI